MTDFECPLKFQYNPDLDENHPENVKLREEFRRMKHEYKMKLKNQQSNIVSSEDFLNSAGLKVPPARTKYQKKK